ncbi:MAG: cobalamin B12-binding protein, partial [Sporomusa sp.]|nr:cobalamin B12-binding protein [Sporomusa sp.]
MHIRERCDRMLLATNKILVAAVVRIEEDKVIQLVKRSLDQGVDPNVIMEEMRTGLEIVHEWYNKGNYFLADLIIVAELFSKVKNIVQDQNVLLSAANTVDVVFGTVKHDIHDIGKNMAISVMQSAGLN